MALDATETIKGQAFPSDADGRLITVTAGSTADAGTIKSVQSTDPAANTEISVTVTTGKIWQLFSVSVALVQGITQTPQPILVIDDGTNTLYEMFGSSAAQDVSTTCQYTWAPSLPLTAQVGATTTVHSTAPLAQGLLLAAGYRIRTSTLGKGANTNYGAASLLVKEFTA